MTYRTFTRTWWKDNRCTIPGPGRKNLNGSTRHDTQEEAREACRSYNLMQYGAKMRGPRGMCMEFEDCA